ncbi:MAG: 5-oxoproline transporter, DUF969 family subunit [Planctomycetota bacterium]
MIKLLGHVGMVLGFASRLNALIVVLVVAVVAGQLAEISVRDVVRLTGQLFVENRWLTLPVILMVPVVGLVERHGLHEHIAALMRRATRASSSGVLLLYQVVRGATSTIGLSVGNHASMIRPLIVPMAEGVAARDGRLTASTQPRLRAHAAAAENVGNFFSDDIFVAVGALLMIRGTLETAGVPVELEDLQAWSIPTALWVIIVGWWRMRRLQRGIVAATVLPSPAAGSTDAGERAP